MEGEWISFPIARLLLSVAITCREECYYAEEKKWFVDSILLEALDYFSV